MKLLLDTHVLLWFLAGDRRLSPTARAAIETSENVRLFSDASVWEISIKQSLGKLTLAEPFEMHLSRALQDNASRRSRSSGLTSSASAVFPFTTATPSIDCSSPPPW